MRAGWGQFGARGALQVELRNQPRCVIARGITDEAWSGVFVENFSNQVVDVLDHNRFLDYGWWATAIAHCRFSTLKKNLSTCTR